MLFSICIPSYNRGHRAVRLVRKLLAMPYSEHEIEIICSNNGSDKYKKEYQEIKERINGCSIMNLKLIRDLRKT